MISDQIKTDVILVDVDGDKRKKEMNRLSNYQIHFGKFKKQKFSDLIKDRDYSIWLLQQTEFIKQNDALKRYLEYQLTTAK
jgi:hypothetical protein